MFSLARGLFFRINYTPELFFQPAEVSTCAVTLAVTPAAGSAAGCHGFRGRAPLPGSAAQSVRDHAPGWNSDTVSVKTGTVLRVQKRVQTNNFLLLQSLNASHPSAALSYVVSDLLRCVDPYDVQVAEVDALLVE